jgi:hypothetical protein
MSDTKSFDYWEYFEVETRRLKAPLYTQFTAGMRHDEALRDFAQTAKKGQPLANVIYAAVHYLLLRGDPHPLRRFYPNLNGGKQIPEDAFPVFRDFVEKNRHELAPIIATRVTNTNEVGRSALLHAGFRTVAVDAGEPLHLIEIGPSAGLNLIWDRYGVRYLKGEKSWSLDVPNPALVIDCKLRGETIPPLGHSPKIAGRVGLELNPVDLSKPESRDWLKALVWPDHVARFARLDAALQAFATAKPEIRAGDALALLPDTLSRIPENEPVCIYHTLVTYQFSAEMREAFDNLLIAVGLRRPIWRVSVEGTLSGDNPMILYRYHDGARDKRTLALCDPHGAWIEWQEQDRALNDN